MPINRQKSGTYALLAASNPYYFTKTYKIIFLACQKKYNILMNYL